MLTATHSTLVPVFYRIHDTERSRQETEDGEDANSWDSECDFDLTS